MGLGLQGIGGIGGIGGPTSGMPTRMPASIPSGGGLSYVPQNLSSIQQPARRNIPTQGPSAMGELTSGLSMANNANKLYEGMGGAETGLGGGLGMASGALGAYGSMSNIASGKGTPMDYVNLAKAGYNVSGMMGGGIGGAGGSGLSAAQMATLNAEAAQGLAGAGELSGVGGTAGTAGTTGTAGSSAGAASAGAGPWAAAMPMAAVAAWAINDYNKGGDTNNAAVNTAISDAGGAANFKQMIENALPKMSDLQNFTTSGGETESPGNPYTSAPGAPYANLFSGKYDTEMNQSLGAGAYADLRKRMLDAQTKAQAIADKINARQAQQVQDAQNYYTNVGG